MSQVSPVYVLEQQTPDEVAQAMIEGGRQEQPFYIFNMDEVYRRVTHFNNLMPRVQIFYAIKCNDTEQMLHLAVALGLGFDCASPGEIYKVMKLGVNPKSIIYAVPCKRHDEMKYAQSSGVRHTTFDSSCDLIITKASWPDAKLLIRIRIDSEAKINLGLKFGCDFETEAFALLNEAASLGLCVVGVAFHVGSLCYSPESYVVGLRHARALFDHEASRGRRMNIVDIGGGFVSDRTDSIDTVSNLINEALEELFPDPAVQIVAEPGRYLCDSAFKLFCGVMGVKKVTQDNSSTNMIYLSNDIYGTLRFDEDFHKYTKFQCSAEIEPPVEEETILWGPTADALDRVMQQHRVRLPRVAPGDWLAVQPHGAYTLTFATRFSSLRPPLIRAVLSADLWSRIKNSPVFQPSDFVLNPDISAPLPSSLPPLLPNSDHYKHSTIPTLQ